MTLVVRPWAHTSDLINVGRLFFSSNPETQHLDRRRACDIVQIWQTRGKVPHHILSTAALVDAQLHDAVCSQDRNSRSTASSSRQTSRRSGSNHSASTIRSQSAVHAMALLSFITGAADIQQTKEHKMSMFDVARSIGLPVQLVELRHVIVHEGVPGLAVLRQATDQALDWLKREYWAHVVVDEETKEMLL